MNEVTSKSLLQRIQQNDGPESWQTFAALYDTMIRRFLAGRGVPPHDADDVIQEVLTFVSQNIGTFDHNGRPGAFRNWLRQVTANRLKEFWRKRQRQAVDGVDLGEMAGQLADDDSGLSGIWRREHNRFVLEHLLSQLAGRFEATTMGAFRSIMIEGRSAQEAASELNMSLGAVRVAQSRVLRLLRKLGEGLID